MKPADTSQQAVLDFLAAPACHDGQTPTRIDTHAAHVFLDRDTALKIKRAVRFPFLDYSTLALRKKACEAEIEVNRPFAAALYRGVVAITRAADGTLAVDGDGEPVEYAVAMNRFDESRTLDHLAGQGGIDDALADALGRAVAQGHARAPVVDGTAFTATLTEIVAQNDGELRGHPDLFAADAVTALTQASRAALTRLAPLMAARARDGHVRRCHGDLHLGNIVLIEGKPVLFDAIEFNPDFAIGDTFYDLAFLLMDLIERGLRHAANIVLNRYLTVTGSDSDLDALALLPLFLSVRAAIRAKVTAARPQRDAGIEQSARDYFALAQQLIAPPPPRLIAVGGLSGTGKSVLARALCPDILPQPGAVLLRSDVMRKTLFDVAETDKLPPEGYAAAVTARVYAQLADKAARVLAAGHSAVVDAVFARAGERDAIAAVAPDRFHGLFLTADLDTRIARVGGRVNDASDADATIATAQEAYDLGPLAWQPVDANGTSAETSQRCKRALGL
ncbi:MAG: AAA family ATPase [Rhodopseudomonas sp.]|nr:AAA family ATPase [Rhodopseudomonas sp.]